MPCHFASRIKFSRLRHGQRIQQNFVGRVFWKILEFLQIHRDRSEDFLDQKPALELAFDLGLPYRPQ